MVFVQRVVVVAVVLAVGACRGVQVGPDGIPGREECPAEAQKVMAAIGLAPLASFANMEMFGDKRPGPGKLIEIRPGPVEAQLLEATGGLDQMTVLFGRAWIVGDRAFIRYYAARTLRGRDNTLPICAVAKGLGGEGPVRGKPLPGPALEVKSTAALFWIVDEFL